MPAQQADPAQLCFQYRCIRDGRSSGLGPSAGEAGEQARVLDRLQFPAPQRGNDHVVHHERRFQQPPDRTPVSAAVHEAGSRD